LSFTNARWLAAATATVAAVVIAGCGSSSTEPTKVSMSISEKGKSASLKAPKSATGGLVEIDFANKGKGPHGVQLVQYTGDHTSKDVLKVLAAGGDKTPEWIRGRGGTPAIPGGQSDTATLNLPAGNYVLVDSNTLSAPGPGPPATADVKFTEGDTGDLPDTPATVKAASIGRDKYKWDISGLKAGNNEITFDSEGHNTLHFILASPVKGDVADSKILSDFAGSRNGPPPPYLDFQNSTASAVLDSGESQTTSLDLKKGRYVFFCPLSDRDGGKSHDQEGLVKVVTIK
jgi:hypothetical protein